MKKYFFWWFWTSRVPSNYAWHANQKILERSVYNWHLCESVACYPLQKISISCTTMYKELLYSTIRSEHIHLWTSMNRMTSYQRIITQFLSWILMLIFASIWKLGFWFQNVMVLWIHIYCPLVYLVLSTDICAKLPYHFQRYEALIWKRLCKKRSPLNTFFPHVPVH